MEQSVAAGLAGILSGLALAGVYASAREAFRRKRATVEKTRQLVLEIEGLLQGRR